MDKDMNSQERKYIAVMVIVFGLFFLLRKITYKGLFDWFYDKDPAIIIMVIQKFLTFLAGTVLFLIAKRRKMDQVAWYAIVISIIVTIGYSSFDIFVVAAVVLLFVGVVLSDKTTKIIAFSLVGLEAVYFAIRHFFDFNIVYLVTSNASVLLYLDNIITGSVVILTGAFLFTKANSKREIVPRALVPKSQNGMESVGITIIYTAIYLLCAMGVYILLTKSVFNGPIDADFVPTYKFIKSLCIILFPAGLLPLTYVLSKKYWPTNEKWSRLYGFLIGLLYISVLGLIIENFDYGYFGYFKLSVFLLLCVVCVLVLILKEKKPKLSLAVLVVAIFSRLILMFLAIVASLITGYYNFVSWYYNMFMNLTFNLIFVSVSAFVLYLALGFALLHHSMKLMPERAD